MTKSPHGSRAEPLHLFGNFFGAKKVTTPPPPTAIFQTRFFRREIFIVETLWLIASHSRHKLYDVEDFLDAKFILREPCGLCLRPRVINSTMWKIVFGSQKLAQATIPNPLRFANAQHLPLKHQGEARTAEDGNPLFIPNKKTPIKVLFKIIRHLLAFLQV